MAFQKNLLIFSCENGETKELPSKNRRATPVKIVKPNEENASQNPTGVTLSGRDSISSHQANEEKKENIKMENTHCERCEYAPPQNARKLSHPQKAEEIQYAQLYHEIVLPKQKKGGEFKW